jgi:hypothetical protein
MNTLRLEIRALALVLVTVMIAFAGCGGGEDTAPQEPADPKVTPEAAPAEPAAEPMEEPETEPAAETAAAGVTGRVTFDGPRPERQPLDTSMDAKCAILHGGEALYSENMVVSEDGGVQHAFVYIKSPPEGDYPVPGEPAVLDQIGCKYVPHIVGMRAGQTLNVKNSDETTHNIRSFPEINKPFNISQPEPGIRERQFPEPEMAVKIKCDFHPWMTAWVFAMTHPFFAVTDESGAYTIEGLPDGEYTLVAWHEEWGELEAAVSVKDGSGEVNFTYAE